ncbi:MAG TPA: OsmC family protein [Actinomycetota bacterium]|jgi:uncharacterized OsmC-like protein|nr:OsmC family protein [Actinomycetota bacterium]
MTTITTAYKGDLLFEATMGSHRLLLDVPESVGGRDRAPTSIELFVASLGSCIAAFVASYCEQAGLDTTDLSVDVGFEQAEEPTRLVDLEVTINLPNADVGNRAEAIRRVAEHCPVHETVEYTLEDIDLEIRDRSKLATGTG